MKSMKIIFVMLMTLNSLSSATAQNIVGKWSCTEDFLVGIGLLYDEIHGTYEFRKNGKFELRINGKKKIRRMRASDYYNGKEFKTSRRHRRDRLLTLKVKGKYIVENNRVTTSVRPKSVKCFIDTGFEQQEITGKEGVNEQKWKFYEDRNYSSATVVADFQINMIKHEKRGLWTWRKASMAFSGDTLTVGKVIKMVKE